MLKVNIIALEGSYRGLPDILRTHQVFVEFVKGLCLSYNYLSNLFYIRLSDVTSRVESGINRSIAA